MWEIKSKNNVVKAIPSTKPEYNGVWMEQSYVTVNVESPTPVNFEIGDYIIYRDERFEINYDPGNIKSAPQYAKGDAFRYENVKFNSLADELTRCDFLDVVLNDNQLHFTGLPKFSFYGNVQDLANRMQANLDRTYGKNTWRVVVSPEYTDRTEINVNVDNPMKVQGALSFIVNDFKAYYTIKGRTLTIGAAGIPAGHLFKYGKGNGLCEIRQDAEADQAIVTRLRAYGSTRNLPHRYYNSLTGADGQKLIPDNMAVQNLMLPSFPYTTQDPYIDSPNIDKLGIREGTIFFDGSQEGLEEIYPSIEGMTAEQLKAAGVPCNSTGALDEIVSAEQMTDNGVGEINEGETQTTAKPPTFKVTLKDLGFDINDHLTTETANLSFKSGMLGGRDFEIVKCTPIKVDNNVTGYELELNRVYDDGIKLWFPYKDYNAAAGDKIVILHIEMPEVYIKAASQRLLEKATEWLSKNDYSRSIYTPKIDEIFMARQHDDAMASGGTIKSLHDTIKEGMLLLFEDDDLNINASIFIDRLTIKEEGEIPTYEVVLKEEKIVGRLDKMQNQIDSLAAGQGSGGYSAAQIRSMIDAYGGSRFLSKIKDDRTPHKISTDKAFEVGEYLAGVSGGIFGKDESGDSFAEVARLYVRVKAFFEELTVIKAGVLAGKQYITPGGGIMCTKVEEVCDDSGNVTAYRCWFLSEQDGKKTECRFIAGDRAISEMFNAKAGTANKVSNHRYWRLVTAVDNDALTDDSGNHYGYIELSASDCETGSDIPQSGDEICQLGSRDDPARQTAMVFSTVDADAPSIRLFGGIDSYSLDGKAVVSFGRDPLTGKIFFRLGADGAKQYLHYTQDGGLVVAGKISSKSTYDDGSGNNATLGDVINDRIVDTDILFIAHTSQTVAPVLPLLAADGTIAQLNGWTTDAPAAQAGLYIWQTTYVLRGDGTASFVGTSCVTGRDGSSYTENLMVNTEGKRETVVVTAGDKYNVFKDMTFELVKGKTYTLSARTNAAKFSSTHHSSSQTNFPDECVLWAVLASGNGGASSIISSADMATDGSKGRTFTWDGSSGKFWFRTNFYAVGTWWVDHVKLEEGSNEHPVWSPAPAEQVGQSAKTVIVNSDATAFMYEDNFNKLTGPNTINLTATLQGTTGYQWSYKTPSMAAFVDMQGMTSATYSLTPTASGWGSDKSMTLRCTSGGVHDEVTIAKVSSGRNGSSYTENLLTGTRDFTGGWDHLDRGTVTADTYKGCRVFETTRQWGATNRPVHLEPGTYTFSAYARVSSQEQVNIYLNDAQNTQPVIGTDWQRISFVFRVDTAGTYNPRIEKHLATSTVLYTAGWKVEEGDNLNPVWSPAASEMLGTPGEDGASYSENLLLKSGTPVSNDFYNIANYFFGDEKPVDGEVYTLTIWGEPAAGVAFGAINSGDNGNKGSVNLSKIADGVYSGKWTWKNFSGNDPGTHIALWCYTSGSRGTTSISRIKFEKGDNHAPVWTPNSSEMVGTDAYTVLLTNESHTFAGDSEKAVESSADCGIVAYKGATQVAATIGTISGMPSGMTVAVSGNGTTAAKFTVSVTTTLTQRQGTLSVPVTVDGKTFDKVFSWSLSLQGPGYTSNMLPGTKDWSGWGVDSGYSKAGTYNGLDVMHGTSPSSGNRDLVLVGKTDLEADTVYTLSVWAKGTGSFTTYVYESVTAQILNIDGTVSSSSASNTEARHLLTSQWKRHYVVFRTIAGITITGRHLIASRLYVDGSEIWIAGAKLEKGENHDTQWSPYPSEQYGLPGVDATFSPNLVPSILYDPNLKGGGSTNAMKWIGLVWGNSELNNLRIDLIGKPIKEAGWYSVYFMARRVSGAGAVSVDINDCGITVTPDLSTIDGDWRAFSGKVYVNKYIGVNGFIDFMNGDGIELSDITVTRGEAVPTSWLPTAPELTGGNDNLLLRSDVEVSNAGYPIASYRIAETLSNNEMLTCTIWGDLKGGAGAWGVFNSSGYHSLTALRRVADGVYSAPVRWVTNTDTNNDTLVVYPAGRTDATAVSTIRRIKLERGTIPTPWSRSSHDFDFITAAMKQDTEVINGLILSALMKLGVVDESGVRRIMAGVNGIVNSSDDLALWAGGDMVDAAKFPTDAAKAAAAIRHSGTAYFANNVIRMLLDCMMVGDNVRLDKDGLRLLSDGKTVLEIANKPVSTDFSLLASNESKFTRVLDLDVPIDVSGPPSYIADDTYQSFDLGTLNAGSTVEIVMSCTGSQPIPDYTGNHGTYPVDGYVEPLRVFLRKTSEEARTGDDIRLYMTSGTSGSSHYYTLNGSAKFTVYTAGSYTVDVGFDGGSNDPLQVYMNFGGNLAFSVKKTISNQMVIGNNGLAVIRDYNAIAINDDMAVMRSGSAGFALHPTHGIAMTLNGGQNWYAAQLSGSQIVFNKKVTL